jgi:uncharacterized protein with PIN domain
VDEMANCPYCNVNLDSIALFKEIIEINSDSGGMLWLEYLCACPKCDKMFRGFEEYENVSESTMKIEESE